MSYSSSDLFRYSAPIVGGISCSFLYSLFSDICFNPSGSLKWTYGKAMNPGLFFGIVYGTIYTYLGEPIIPLLYRRRIQ
jgi:hypothetical protein